jgi:hypothetical protein
MRRSSRLSFLYGISDSVKERLYNTTRDQFTFVQFSRILKNIGYTVRRGMIGLPLLSVTFNVGSAPAPNSKRLHLSKARNALSFKLLSFM